MTERKGRADRGTPSVRPSAESASKPDVESTGPEALPEDIEHKERNIMPSYANRTETQQLEGVTVFGEAVRRIMPERAEFLVELTASAGTVAQVLRDSQTKTMQITQALAPLGVQQSDVQTISAKVHNVYSPMMPTLPGYGSLPQLGPGGYSPYAAGLGVQPEVQLSSYYARNILRISVRELARAGEVADAAARAGATIVGGLNFRSADETNARRTALEAAGKDARLKAEALAAAAGKQVGDPVVLTEEILANNGTYTALRATTALTLTPGVPDFTGEFEYYARVTATFRFQ
jgi:uncharacterized protein YggE